MGKGTKLGEGEGTKLDSQKIQDYYIQDFYVNLWSDSGFSHLTILRSGKVRGTKNC